jgi:hypothetical protein
MRQSRDKGPAKADASDDEHRGVPRDADAQTVDDAYQYLTRAVGWQDDLAIYELNEKFTQGRLRLHFRRTDVAGAGQQGYVPSVSWHSRQLSVARDCSRDETRGPVEWATGRRTANNDGRALVQMHVSEDPGHTYDLTVSARRVRMLWPTQSRADAEAAPIKHQDLADAVRTRIASDHRPGVNEPWDRFCDKVRESCGAKADDRGFGDKTIKRIVGELSK